MPARRRLSHEQQLQLISWYQDGDSMSVAAAKAGITAPSLHHILKKHGVQARPRGRADSSFETKQLMIERYRSGMTMEQAASSLGYRTQNPCMKAITECGLPKKDRRVWQYHPPIGQRPVASYGINTKAFDNAATDEASGYWVGFLAADGCVFHQNGTSRISLALAARDYEAVEEFRSFLGDGPAVRVLQRQAGGFNRTAHSEARFSVHSVELARRLATYGVVPRKSFGTEYRLVTENRAFWRGMVCGDGTIGVVRSCGQLSPYITFIGTKRAVEQYLEFVTNTLAISTQAQPCRNRTIWTCRFSARKAVEVIRGLFDGAVVSLSRKQVIANSIIERFRYSSISKHGAKSISS